MLSLTSPRHTSTLRNRRVPPPAASSQTSCIPQARGSMGSRPKRKMLKATISAGSAGEHIVCAARIIVGPRIFLTSGAIAADLISWTSQDQTADSARRVRVASETRAAAIAMGTLASTHRARSDLSGRAVSKRDRRVRRLRRDGPRPLGRSRGDALSGSRSTWPPASARHSLRRSSPDGSIAGVRHRRCREARGWHSREPWSRRDCAGRAGAKGIRTADLSMMPSVNSCYLKAAATRSGR